MKRSQSEGTLEGTLEDVRRRRIELEKGTKRTSEDDSEVPEASRIRIEVVEEDDLHEPDWMWKEEDPEYDTLTGETLDAKLVQKGKEEELKRFKEMGVYRYVTEQEALNDRDSVRVDVRWVIVNKGMDKEPNIRCRLVAREFAEKGNRDDLFVGTPPLTSIRVLLSL